MSKNSALSLVRIWDATRYSAQGLKACFQHEAAFRQEVILLGLAVLLSFWVADSVGQQLALIGIILAVMVVELLNSAIEDCVDMISPEYSEPAGRAKDMGSAAVFLGHLMCAVFWLYALLT